LITICDGLKFADSTGDVTGGAQLMWLVVHNCCDWWCTADVIGGA
jgi:hypothetical protein